MFLRVICNSLTLVKSRLKIAFVHSSFSMSELAGVRNGRAVKPEGSNCLSIPSCLVALMVSAEAAWAQPSWGSLNQDLIGHRVVGEKLASLALSSLRMFPLEPQSDTALWFTSFIEAHSGDVGKDEWIAGSFGVAKVLSPTVEFGFGADIDTTSFELFFGEGVKSEMTTNGLQAYLTWMPRENLSLQISGTYTDVENDFRVGYAYAGGVAYSDSTQEGHMFGVAAFASWVTMLTDGVSFMPFLQYDVTRSDFGEFSETTGPLPSNYDASQSAARIFKLGAEVGGTVLSDTAVFANLAWAHQFETHMPAISGYNPGTNTTFSFGDDPIKQNWGEVMVGFSHPIKKNLDFFLSLNSSFGGDFQPRYGASIGFNLAL